jgi:hypothetical protein
MGWLSCPSRVIRLDLVGFAEFRSQIRSQTYRPPATSNTPATSSPVRCPDHWRPISRRQSRRPCQTSNGLSRGISIRLGIDIETAGGAATALPRRARLGRSGQIHVRWWVVYIGRQWAFSCPPTGTFSCPPIRGTPGGGDSSAVTNVRSSVNNLAKVSLVGRPFRVENGVVVALSTPFLYGPARP